VRHQPRPTLLPYTTLFRSPHKKAHLAKPLLSRRRAKSLGLELPGHAVRPRGQTTIYRQDGAVHERGFVGEQKRCGTCHVVWLARSEEHTSELQSPRKHVRR